MTKSIAVAAGLAIAASASANDFVETKSIAIGDFDLEGGQSITFDIDTAALGGGPVVGFQFSGIYEDADGAGGSWASDLQLTVTTSSGTMFVVGGFDAGFDENWTWPNAGFSDAPNDGVPNAELASEHFPYKDAPEDKGLWSFTFTNDFSTGNPINWNNVQIDLYNIPAPGAAALLGVAGLAGLRRRR